MNCDCLPDRESPPWILKCRICDWQTPKPVNIHPDRFKKTCSGIAGSGKEGPSFSRKVVNFSNAVKRWLQAGKPMRDDKDVLQIFEQHCQPCEFQKDGTCTHGMCGCKVLPPSKESKLISLLASPAMANKLRMGTEFCPVGKWGTKPRWVTNEDRARVTRILATMVPKDVTAVAGVGRSGVSSAMQLAELLHLHPFVVSMRGQLDRLPTGFRFISHKEDDGALLIVDDTICTGSSFKKLRSSLRHINRKPIYLAATYVAPASFNLVDFYAEELAPPHYLEWNFFNSAHSPHAALDFDGVICRECRPEEDDDGKAYENFLATAEPLYLPRRVPVPLIVTARMEKYRQQTESWLSQHGVKCDRLVMGPWSTLAERRQANIAEFKAAHFGKSKCLLFVESCPTQAKAIAELSGKRVICPATSEVHN